MSPRIKFLSLCLAAPSLGLLCGKVIHTASHGGQSEAPAVTSAVGKLPGSFSPISTSARYLWSETADLRDPGKFPDEVGRIHREPEARCGPHPC